MGSGDDQEEAERAERRALVRHYTCFPFQMQRGDSGDTQDMEIALVRDLSLSGAYLLAGSDPAVGTRVQLHLDVFEDPEALRTVEGKVIRTERRPEDVAHVWPFGIAVQFNEVQTDLESAVVRLAAAANGEPSS